MAIVNSAEAGGTLELGAVAAQFFDAGMWITLGAALLISIAAFVVMLLYERAIFRECQRRAQLPEASRAPEQGSRPRVLSAIGSLEIQTEKPSGPRSPSARLPTFQHARTAFRCAARFYALGGCVHASTSVGLLFLLGSILSRPHRPG
jgi:hypothetical protein